MIENLTLKDILIGSGILATVVGAVLTYVFTRRKTSADAHKSEVDANRTEFETFKLEMSQFLELLEKLKTAHEQSLVDDKTIAQLEMNVAECRAGHKSWQQCRVDAVQFLRLMEMELQGHTTLESLIESVVRMRKRLEEATI